MTLQGWLTGARVANSLYCCVCEAFHCQCQFSCECVLTYAQSSVDFDMLCIYRMSIVSVPLMNHHCHNLHASGDFFLAMVTFKEASLDSLNSCSPPSFMIMTP